MTTMSRLRPAAATLLSLLLQSRSTSAHTRLECPPPRSGNTGIKTGPCDAPDDLSLSPHPLTPGAFNTITWLESIPHPGAPARLALSLDGDDSIESFESCLLLDHIPHDEYSTPNFVDETSWHRSSITVWIPDVYCERCHLQLITVMTDEVHGVPADTSCVYEGALASGRILDSNRDLPACREVYHSCAPISINGSTPRNDIDVCDTSMFEDQLSWPMKPTVSSDEGGTYDYSTYYYKGNPGVYNLTDSRLMKTGAPIKDCPSFQFCDPETYLDMTNLVPEDASFTAMEGSCAAMVTMEVEPFQLGKLPSTPKDMSAEVVVPGGEADPCAPCEQMIPCYTDACVLRNVVSGKWTGPAEPCNAGAALCEPCFADSACFGFGSGGDDGDGAVALTGTGNDESDTSDDVDQDKAENATAASADEGNITLVDKGEDIDNSGSRLQSVGWLVLVWNIACVF